MTTTLEYSSRLSSAVTVAVDTIADALSLKAKAKGSLVAFIEDLARPFPKLPHVRYYAARTRTGGVNYRATYRVPGRKLRTERLGRVGKIGYERARRVSDVLVQVHARLMKADDAYRLLYVDSTPIETHLQRFEASITANGAVPRYVKNVGTRLRRCVELGEFERIGDIRSESIPGLIQALRLYVEPDKKIRLSESTINDYLATLRQFTKWATPTLLPIDPLTNTGGIRKVIANKRRDVQPAELAEIVRAARTTVSGFVMAGPDRAMLYLAAYATGLRANELRQLEVPWLKLDGAAPYIAVPAKVTKTKSEARQPLPVWFVADLRAWLGKRDSGLLWPTMPRDVQLVFESDRAAARSRWIEAAPDAKVRQTREQADFLQRKTSDGQIVFHSLRHAYATRLLANMDLKSAQMLTRHKTAALLTDTYAHGRMSEAAAGVERAIPNPLREALAQGAALSTDS